MLRGPTEPGRDPYRLDPQRHVLGAWAVSFQPVKCALDQAVYQIQERCSLQAPWSGPCPVAVSSRLVPSRWLLGKEHENHGAGWPCSGQETPPERQPSDRPAGVPPSPEATPAAPYTFYPPASENHTRK